MRRTLPGYVQWLLIKENYPHLVESVELVQTHISYVLIAGQYVYKFKKPADFGFLDFTSLAKRKFYCEEELRLNRRLCPQVYLQIIALKRSKGGFCWGEGGETEEYAVKMRRLSEEKMMRRVIDRGELQEKDIVRIIEKLTPFYQLADRSERVKQFGAVEAVSKTIHDNFTETKPYVGGSVLPKRRFAKIERLANRFLENSALFAARIQQNKVCECHGDLHSGNICLEEDVVIFDCIEFNESLRCTDIAADLAFMAMDLDYHGLRDFRDLFINRYIELSGDEQLLDMLAFYMCYRAYVRGKIGLLTSIDEHVATETRTAAERSARSYFMLAEEYGERLED